MDNKESGTILLVIIEAHAVAVTRLADLQN